MNEGDFEVVTVGGGGAAGLSAALVLGRARRRVAVIDAGQPRNAPAAPAGAGSAAAIAINADLVQEDVMNTRCDAQAPLWATNPC